MLLEPQFEEGEVWLAAGWPWLLLRSDYKQISDVFWYYKDLNLQWPWGVALVSIEVMNARPYLILRMTRRVNAFKTNLTCWLVRKYLIRTLWLQALLTRVLLKIVGEWLILQSRLGGFCSLDAEEGVSFFTIYWNIQVVFEWDSEREFAGRPCMYIHWGLVGCSIEYLSCELEVLLIDRCTII